MKLSFSESVAISTQEFAMLRNKAENKGEFDRAVDWMNTSKYRVDTEDGVTRCIDGVQARYLNYDWGAEYDEHPHFVFYDFFRGPLMNRYSRNIRGLV